jgi:copper oxidase (laccase) domain-containing protein
VLLCSADGSAVAAAHAGWRGLAGGVLEATLAELRAAARDATSPVHAWLGPCIGPDAFEVGADVLIAFGVDPNDIAGQAAMADGHPRFRPAPRPDGQMRWRADLAALTRDRLLACGVASVSGGRWCTVGDPSRFFSFRRDGLTGRMAASVWRR